jgi:hypothetical protein
MLFRFAPGNPIPAHRASGINRILCNGGSELRSIVIREFGLQTPRHFETAA